METRRLPGTDRTVSVLGVALAPLVEGPPDRALGAASIGFLRRAWDLGISVYDLEAGGAAPAAQRAVATAFPGPEPGLFVMGPLPPGAERARGPALIESLETVRRRLGGRPLSLLWLPGDRSVGLRERFGEFDDLRSAGLIGGWGLALDHPDEVMNWGARDDAGGPSYYRFAYNLLEPGADRVLRSPITTRDGPRVFVTEPHAHGLLDGSLLEPGAPLPPSALERRAFAHTARRLLQLAPLTAGGHRTLPEAAVQFAIAPPGVACALLRTRRPELLRASVEALGRPAIPSELLRPILEGGEPGAEQAASDPDGGVRSDQLTSGTRDRSRSSR